MGIIVLKIFAFKYVIKMVLNMLDYKLLGNAFVIMIMVNMQKNLKRNVIVNVLIQKNVEEYGEIQYLV